MLLNQPSLLVLQVFKSLVISGFYKMYDSLFQLLSSTVIDMFNFFSEIQQIINILGLPLRLSIDVEHENFWW